MVADSEAYADLSGLGAANEYKLEQTKIRKCLQDHLDGVGGPDGSITEKICQLHIHETLHLEFDRGNVPKCQLSFYLLQLKRQREVHISQLKAAVINSKSKADLNWTAQRLEKCPLGMNVLADRGFADCSMYYKHLNPIITPSFLDGRSQFSTEEIAGDRTKCKDRYSSEAFFSRFSDSEYVTDKVPRHRFHYLADVLKFCMAMSNLKQPYMIPRGQESYFPKNTFYQKRVSRSICEDIEEEKKEDDGDLESAEMVYNNNFIIDAMPEEYYADGLNNVGLLNDGKDIVTDTIRINSCLSRGQFSDKMKASAARFIAWTLPCGLSATYSPLFLGRISEKAIVEFWGGSTSEFILLPDDE